MRKRVKRSNELEWYGPASPDEGEEDDEKEDGDEEEDGEDGGGEEESGDEEEDSADEEEDSADEGESGDEEENSGDEGGSAGEQENSVGGDEEEDGSNEKETSGTSAPLRKARQAKGVTLNQSAPPLRRAAPPRRVPPTRERGTWTALAARKAYAAGKGSVFGILTCNPVGAAIGAASGLLTG